MTEQPDDAASAKAAAELLLRLSIAAASPTLEKAEALLGDEPRVPLFREIIRLEVGGSMAMERLVHAYGLACFDEIKNLDKDVPASGSHLLRAMANIFIGGILAYVDDMPDTVKGEFLKTLADGLNAGLFLRARSKAKATEKRKAH